MAYTSRSNRPNEFANKTNHTHLINDKEIQDFLKKCSLPKKSQGDNLKDSELLLELQEPKNNPIKYVIAIDGGYTHIEVQKDFPSSTVAFFQFGAFILKLEDWKNLGNQTFISPEEMSKFNELERIKLVLPTKLVSLESESCFTDSVRRTIYDFFMKEVDGVALMETLKWLLYEEYQGNGRTKGEYVLLNPYESDKSINLFDHTLKRDFTFEIEGKVVYLSDVFELTKTVSDEIGAECILGNLATFIEQIILVHYMRQILKKNPKVLEEVLFIKDGSLAFFDVSFKLRKPMRKLIKFLFERHNLYLVGLEKSGPFTDHAVAIAAEKEENGEFISRLPRGQFFLLDNDYIYKYITPGISKIKTYGMNMYYSGKVILKTMDGNTFVANIPMNVIEDREYDTVIRNPSRNSYKNIDTILSNLSQLKCQMYDNSLVPITLVNKLVSLANHPSQGILEKFVKDAMNNK
jgi:hypothetical protein